MRAFDILHKSLAHANTGKRSLSGKFADVVWADVLAQAESSDELEKLLLQARDRAETLDTADKYKAYKNFAAKAAASIYEAGASREHKFEEIFTQDILKSVASNIALQS